MPKSSTRAAKDELRKDDEFAEMLVNERYVKSCFEVAPLRALYKGYPEAFVKKSST
jgi:hypothetical protein